MPDDFDDRLDSLEDIVRRLTGMLVKQEEFNRQQVEINARLETLLTRVFRSEDNGRDA